MATEATGFGDYYADEYYECDEDDSCTMCDGEGEQECPDFIQCCARHTSFENPDGQVVFFCACSACNGSGLAKDQTIW